MGIRVRNAFLQLSYCYYELGLIVNKKWWRWLICWFDGSASVILSYRLDRFFYLLFGRAWALLRVFFFPLFLFLKLIGVAHEIHYGAQIGKGLKILHASLGIVVSKHAIIGENLTLTGGNCIGGRKHLTVGDLILGNHINLGANAVVLGPIKIGDNTMIGAGALVVHDSPGDEVLIGTPARSVSDWETY